MNKSRNLDQILTKFLQFDLYAGQTFLSLETCFYSLFVCFKTFQTFWQKTKNFNLVSFLNLIFIFDLYAGQLTREYIQYSLHLFTTQETTKTIKCKVTAPTRLRKEEVKPNTRACRSKVSISWTFYKQLFPYGSVICSFSELKVCRVKPDKTTTSE